MLFLLFFAFSQILCTEDISCLNFVDGLCNNSCIEGYFGWNCHMKQDQSFCVNGIHTVYGMIDDDPKTASHISCVCNDGWVGPKCEFFCTGTLDECLTHVDYTKQCSTFILRKYGGMTYYQRDYVEYYEGFKDDRHGDMFLGLESLVDLVQDDSQSMKTLKVIQGEDELECFGFYIHDEDEQFFTEYLNCEGSSTLEEYLPPKYHPFSYSGEEQNLDQNGISCASYKGGAYWYPQIDYCNGSSIVSPTGYFKPSEDDSDGTTYIDCLKNPEYTFFHSANLASTCPLDVEETLEIQVCEYQSLEECVEIVVREKGNNVFNRNFEKYKEGFGDCDSKDCFRALDYLSQVNSRTIFPMKMKVKVVDEGEIKNAVCNNVRIGTEDEDYLMSISDCNTDDEMDLNVFLEMDGKPFSTIDKNSTCAERNGGGGWWYNEESCSGFNPTGKYGYNGVNYYGLYYDGLTEIDESLDSITIEMCGSIIDTDGVSATEMEELEVLEQCVSILTRTENTSYFIGYEKLALYKDEPMKIVGSFVDSTTNEENTIQCFGVEFGDDGKITGTDVCYGWYKLTSDTSFSFLSDLESIGESISSSADIKICEYVKEEEIDKYEKNGKCVLFFNRTIHESVENPTNFSSKNSLNFEYGFGSNKDNGFFLGMRNLEKLTRVPQFLQVNYYLADSKEYEYHCGFFFVKDNKLYMFECGGDEEDTDIFNGEHDGVEFWTYDIEDIEGKEDYIFSTFFDMESRDILVIEMSVCLLKKSFGKTNFVELAKTKYSDYFCDKDCSKYHELTFDLSYGEQLFIFSEENFSGDYLDVFTGPKVKIEVPQTMVSFYTSKPKQPVFFSLDDMEYGTSGEMLYASDNCNELITCGISAVRSAYLPPGYLVTFSDCGGTDVSDCQYFPLGSMSDLTESTITLDIQSWTIEYSTSIEEIEYPVIYELPNFGGKAIKMKYDCSESCFDSTVQSINVVEDYIVDLFEFENFEGTMKRITGPLAMSRLDGYFLKNEIGSYKSGTVSIDSTKILITSMTLNADSSSESSTNVSSFEVNNPTPLMRTMTFTDEYEEFTEVSVSDIRTVETEYGTEEQDVEVSENCTTTVYSASAAATATINTETGAQATAVAANQATLTAGTVVTTESGVTGVLDYSTEKSDTTTRVSDTLVTAYQETMTKLTEGNVESETVTKKFEYECIAQPYTKTTCTAKQTSGNMEIEYEAIRRITYTDGKIEDTKFSGVMKGKYSTKVNFVISESSLERCTDDFSQFNGDCYKGLSVVLKDDVNELISSSGSLSALRMKEFNFTEGIDICYSYDGSVPTSIHSLRENYFAVDLCGTYEPAMIGVYYDYTKDEHVNYDGSDFDFSNFNEDAEKPNEDAYIYIDRTDGTWYYSPFDVKLPKCVICVQDLNLQILTSYYQHDMY